MWTAHSYKLEREQGLRITLALNSQPATYDDVLNGWQSSPKFRTFFNSILADAPYSGFRWEIPAVTKNTLHQPFEFVLLDSPGLLRAPDPAAFKEHFESVQGADVVVFSNLGGDSTLIVPCPIAGPSAYGHLADFVRKAPESQKQSLWKCVGDTLGKKVGDKPLWLSTAGAGVAWLHVRVDQRAKYYGFSPYTIIHP
jgi:hypothetical protein